MLPVDLIHSKELKSSRDPPIQGEIHTAQTPATGYSMSQRWALLLADYWDVKEVELQPEMTHSRDKDGEAQRE